VLGDRLEPANHLSYFTILSNFFAAVVALLGVFNPVSAQLRGAATLYMAVTGIIYALLLRDNDVATPAYANWAMHVAAPILVVVDWLLAPERTKRWWTWLAFPAAYLVYSLVRGPIVDWYPYPFLDPRRHGYGSVALGSLFVAVTFVVLAFAISWIGTKLAQKRSKSLSYD